MVRRGVRGPPYGPAARLVLFAAHDWKRLELASWSAFGKALAAVPLRLGLNWLEAVLHTRVPDDHWDETEAWLNGDARQAAAVRADRIDAGLGALGG